MFKFEAHHCGGVVVCGVGGFLLVLPRRGVFGGWLLISVMTSWISLSVMVRKSVRVGG